MLITTPLLAALIAFMVGAVIVWGNPQRIVNKAIFTCSLHLALWLGCLHLALNPATADVLWLKLACAVAAFWPLHFRLVREAIVNGLQGFSVRFLRWGLGWLIVSAALAILPFTEIFIPAHSTDTNRIYGWGYYAYIAVDVALYAYLFTQASRTIKNLQGARRIELQVWVIGGSSMIIALFTLMALNMATHNRVYIRVQPLLVIGFYACTVYAITSHRILDARQVVLVGVEKILLVIAVAAMAYVLDAGFSAILPDTVALIATTGFALLFAAMLSGWLNRWLNIYPEAVEARKAAFAVTRRNVRLENLEKEFIDLLKGWGNTERAAILVGLAGSDGAFRGSNVELATGSDVAKAMKQLRWATPERLARERSTSEREALADFLSEQNFGALVIGDGPALTTLIGVGVQVSHRPFTHPQIAQLMEFASIIQSALERAHLSAKAQHAEQLATVGLLGASLAHEIRNPLVSIKTFVQLLPSHHQDAAFREKFFRLISDEVSRIDQLTEQLLDLASPRAYVAEFIELHPVLTASLELAAAKASRRKIQFLTDFQANPDRAFTDASAAKQVMLNLCFNAIQAIESHDNGDQAERWIKIATRNIIGGVEMAIADSGPGIAPDIRPRLFQPFQTTRSSGFGLGLAICRDILANLNASISVDPPAPGHGATFRVLFPCQPSSS